MRIADFYTETREDGNPYRKAYLDALVAFAERRNREQADLRTEHGKWSLAHPEEARREFCDMLGWPMNETFEGLPTVNKTLIAHGQGVSIYRVQMEAIPGIPLYGLLFLKDGGEKLPFVIAQHGGQGSPELCSGFYNGNSDNYNRMTERVLEYNVNVFAPQLLLWEVAKYRVECERFNHGIGQRQNLDIVWKQMGGSMAAMEVTMLRRAIDYFAVQDYVDPDRIGMVGLSYGGFYTLFTTAAETRIRCAILSCYLSSKELSTWNDFVFEGASSKFLDPEVVLLIHPRKVWIASGYKDYVFDYADTEKDMERLKSYFGGTLPENITYVPFEGDHEFCNSDKMMADFMKELLR